MIAKVLVAFVSVLAAQLAAGGLQQEPDSPPEPKCSSLCALTPGPTYSVQNPGGGTMTVTYEDLSPGLCWCNEMVPPCEELDPCKGVIKFAFDNHVSWRTWVPDATVSYNGGTWSGIPLCAMPASGSDDPPDHSVELSGCGSTIEMNISQWKMRNGNPPQTQDINPDLTPHLSCSACEVNNCQ